ncbi:MAG TPA: CBS domain-containing protein [Solirubrobacteraceae bacterium]|nr:CBS domain-containing protein [Solirubrobacteraceae bacterium]
MRLSTVADAMTTRTASVGRDATLQEASAAMLDAGVLAAVVVDGGQPVGLVSAETIAGAMAAGLDVTAGRAEAAADRGAVVVRADDLLLDAHERMHRAGRESAAVVGDDGRLVGLLVDDTA